MAEFEEFERGDTAAARAAWLQALPIPTGRRMAILGLASLDELHGRARAARQWLLLGTQMDPGDVRLLSLLGDVERSAGLSAEASETWRRLVAIDPHFADSVLRARRVP